MKNTIPEGATHKHVFASNAEVGSLLARMVYYKKGEGKVSLCFNNHRQRWELSVYTSKALDNKLVFEEIS